MKKKLMIKAMNYRLTLTKEVGMRIQMMKMILKMLMKLLKVKVKKIMREVCYRKKMWRLRAMKKIIMKSNPLKQKYY